MMRIKIYILIALTGLYGCSEVYQPDIETVEPYLVVEGFINTVPGYNYVYLSESRSYNEVPYFDGLSGAVVTVTDDKGNTYSYEGDGKGIYKLLLNRGNVAVVGGTYILSVVTSDGDTFESTPQKLVASPPIRRQICEHSQETILTEDVYGSPMELTYSGMNIITETDGILPSDNFYLYNWRAYEEHQAGLQLGLASYDIYRHRPLSAKYINLIRTGNADEFPEFHLRDQKIVFVRFGDMIDYTPIFPDSFTLNYNRFDGLLFHLEQSSVSAEAYGFYHEIESQLSAEGHLFDPISPQIKGNMHCVNDETKKVIGIFYAADVSIKDSYFFMDRTNRTYSADLESLPTLYLDTCAWSLPFDWILPPF
jgi:hypothetical protein